MAAFPNADEEEDPTAGSTTPPSATDINTAGPAGTAQAKPIQGTVAKQAAAKTGAALAGQDQAQAGQTMYSQVKANIDKLDKKGKQRILQLLQKSMAAPAAGGAMGAMAGQLAKAGAKQPNTMANAPISKTKTAKPGNPNATPAVEPAPVPTAAPSGKKPVRVRGKKAAQPAPQQQVAGKINTGSMVLEGFSLFRKK